LLTDDLKGTEANGVNGGGSGGLGLAEAAALDALSGRHLRTVAS